MLSSCDFDRFILFSDINPSDAENIDSIDAEELKTVSNDMTSLERQSIINAWDFQNKKNNIFGHFCINIPNFLYIKFAVWGMASAGTVVQWKDF